ncbi:hypothetical protein CGCA056_v005720 [Colletotrichum aenigma]|uniref:uncharacterized protein n=1 Tax=Colletotrichum aenigma TaxID=1215731 RepID=UPI001872BD72|nr:uncharacterized protein CGCA056_v005720 [Colletotrichum aenigma]KAF5523082.1 hypothetical protein CGCA056_v005720 [Colletotrichum aenigma]
MQLQQALVTVNLPVDDYHRWLMRVQDVAARLERLPAITRGNSSYRPRAPKASRHCDDDGDMVMTGADALVDTRCDLYALIDHNLACKLRLPIVDRSKQVLGSFSDSIGATKATGVVVFNLKLCGYDEKIFAYTVRGLSDDLFLGKLWMERNCILYDAAAQRIRHRRGGVDLRLKGEEEPERVRQIRTARLLPGAPFATLYKRKALMKKTEKADLKALLPPAILAEFRKLFQPDEAANLPPHRPRVDHRIPIKQDESGNKVVLPWGPLYSMS